MLPSVHGSHTRSRGYTGHCPSGAPAEASHHTSVCSTDGSTWLVATGPRCFRTIGSEARTHTYHKQPLQPILFVPKRKKNKPAGREDPLEAQWKQPYPTSLLLQSTSRTKAVARPTRSSRDQGRSGAGQTPAQKLRGGGQDLSEGPQDHLQTPGLWWLYGACIMGVGNSPPPRGSQASVQSCKTQHSPSEPGGGGGTRLGPTIASGTLSVSMKRSHAKSTARARGSLTTGARGKSPSRVLT